MTNLAKAAIGNIGASDIINAYIEATSENNDPFYSGEDDEVTFGNISYDSFKEYINEIFGV